METVIKTVSAGIAAILSFLYGEPTLGLYALVALMVIDYCTGLMKGFVNKDLDSAYSFKGLFKKVVILFLIAIAHIADMYVGSDIIMGAVIGFYIANEALSIIENAAILGVPIPDVLRNALNQLKGDKD